MPTDELSYYFFSKQKRPTDLEYSSSILSTTEVSPSSGGGMIIISHAELLSASQSLLFSTQAKCVVVAYNKKLCWESQANLGLVCE